MSLLGILIRNVLCVIVAIPLAILWLWLGLVISSATSERLLVFVAYIIVTGVFLASLSEWASPTPSPALRSGGDRE
jgi:hypothetical protein